jgi:signal transduction histidine kinase
MRADVMRQHTRALSSELSVLSGQPPRDVLVWFTHAACEAFKVPWASVWLFDEAGRNWLSGSTPLNANANFKGESSWLLTEEMHAYGWTACTQRDVPSQVALELLHYSQAGLAVVVTHHGIRGLLVLGRRRGHRELVEEEISAVMLLAEQLAITLNAGLLQAERLAAERRALQSEKLSTLGLLASSIAHEVKNPLSSIKTIASVMYEQLGQESEHAEDLRLILEEIDRLAGTTAQLLQFARPAVADGEPSRVEQVLAGTMQVMRHMAKQRGVALESPAPGTLLPVQADNNALREIFFNLVSNAIEAAGEGGSVRIECQQQNGHVVTTFHDSGPGISPAIQDQLFQPFFTTKDTGTGLGLYVTNRRVRECGGAIDCVSGPETGTCFTVKLPCIESTQNKNAADLP